MPGMHNGLNSVHPVLVAAFRSALLRQGLSALLVLATLAVIWACLREWRPGLVRRAAERRAAAAPEPAARRLLRIGFGVLWIFDGVLQAQPAMVTAMPRRVLAPAARTSPAWVQHTVNWAVTAWSAHPVQAAAASVWIQAGIGIWMLAAARGGWSRLAGAAGVAWGLLVWTFGEAFGGIFAPGLTVLFGAPGAVLIYCVGGALVAAPERIWRTGAAGRRLLAGIGIFLIAMAVLQAWPGRGFWQGHQHGHPGALASMITSMAGTPQPSPMAKLVAGFGSLTIRHGFAVNLTAVLILALTGLGLLLARRPALLQATVALAGLFCLADWLLIEDLGFFGGLGTDPNSMLPLVLLIAAGYLAVARPATAALAHAAPSGSTGTADTARPVVVPGWRDRLRPATLTSVFASVSATGLLAGWAAALVVLGAAPMAMFLLGPAGRI